MHVRAHAGNAGRTEALQVVSPSTSSRPRSRPGVGSVPAAALTLGLPGAPAARVRNWEKLSDMPVEKREPGAAVFAGMRVADAP